MPAPHEVALDEAKDAANRGAPDYADRVLVIWHRKVDAEIVRTQDERPCTDCQEHAQLWTTRSWGEICGRCYYSRLDNGGTNTRKGDIADRRARKRRGSR